MNIRIHVRRLVCVASLFALLTSLSTAGWAIDVSDDSYAAIAFAPSTRNFRYAYNYGSRHAAEQAALRGMTEKDAKIVCWVNRGFCALAIGDDGSYGTGWTFGDDATNTEAIDTALQNCREHTKTARLAVCLVSDGQYIYEPKPVPKPITSVLPSEAPKPGNYHPDGFPPLFPPLPSPEPILVP